MDLTGVECMREDGIFHGAFRLSGDTFLARHLPDDAFYGTYPRVMAFNASGHFGKVREHAPFLFPLLYPSDKDAEVLGTYADSEYPALVRKENDAFVAIVCGVKSLTADIVREIAREAGCHIYCESEDVFYASRRFLTHHASQGGEKVIHLPRLARVSDAYDNTELSPSTDTITFRARLGDTHTFRIEYQEES